MYIISMKSIVKEIYILILGMFGFSMLGQYIVLNVFHLPISLMEIYYIPLLLLYRNRIISTIRIAIKKMPYFLLLTFFAIFSSMFFGIANSGKISVIIDYRSILYLLLVLLYVYKNDITIPTKFIYKFSLYIIFGELLYILFISTSDISSSINCIAIAAAILSAFCFENYFAAFFAFVLGCCLGVISGFRIGIVISVISFFEAILFMLIRNKKNMKIKTFIRRFLVLIVTILCAIVFVNYYEPIILKIADYTGMSQFAVFRITERMRGLLRLDFNMSQDIERLTIFQYPFERFWSCMVPRGLIGSFIEEYWMYIDVPILYLYDLFGSLGAFALLGGLFVRILRKYKNYRIYFLKNIIELQNEAIILSLLLVPILAILFVLNGTFIVVSFQAIETGIILGFILKRTDAFQINK